SGRCHHTPVQGPAGLGTLFPTIFRARGLDSCEMFFLFPTNSAHLRPTIPACEHGPQVRTAGLLPGTVATCGVWLGRGSRRLWRRAAGREPGGPFGRDLACNSWVPGLRVARPGMTVRGRTTAGVIPAERGGEPGSTSRLVPLDAWVPDSALGFRD